MLSVDESKQLIKALSSSEFNLKFETEIAAAKIKILENLGIQKIIPLHPGIINFRSKFLVGRKIHHTEFYPSLYEPDRQNQVSYVFVHGCNAGKNAVVRIYKLSQNLKRVEAEFELIEEGLVLNDSFPFASWHSQTTLTQKGVLSIQIHGEGEPDEDDEGRTGPFSIKLLNLDFESQSV